MKIEDCTKRYKATSEHQLMITKLMTYKKHDTYIWRKEQLETLQQLMQGDKFLGEVRIPQFTFDCQDDQIKMEIEFMYGSQCHKLMFKEEDLTTIYDSLVDHPGDFGVHDYNKDNFIKNNDIGEKGWTLAYVDLEGIYPCTREDRQIDFFRGLCDFKVSKQLLKRTVLKQNNIIWTMQRKK